MEETYEEQVMRCMQEMVQEGIVTMKEGEDGEQYFALSEAE